jgi:hypothetical protein
MCSAGHSQTRPHSKTIVPPPGCVSTPTTDGHLAVELRKQMATGQRRSSDDTTGPLSASRISKLLMFLAYLRKNLAGFAAATDYLATPELDGTEPTIGAPGAPPLRTAGVVLLQVGTAFVVPTDGQ